MLKLVPFEDALKSYPFPGLAFCRCKTRLKLLKSRAENLDVCLIIAKYFF